MHQLDHENLDVYRCSLTFAASSFRLIGRLPRGEGEIRDQWRRAAMSILLNIAEGCGRPAPADRARFHAIARGSAMECSALIDIALLLGHIDEQEAQAAKELLVRIVAMLSKLCRTNAG